MEALDCHLLKLYYYDNYLEKNYNNFKSVVFLPLLLLLYPPMQSQLLLSRVMLWRKNQQPTTYFSSQVSQNYNHQHNYLTTWRQTFRVSRHSELREVNKSWEDTQSEHTRGLPWHGFETTGNRDKCIIESMPRSSLHRNVRQRWNRRELLYFLIRACHFLRPPSTTLETRLLLQAMTSNVPACKLPEGCFPALKTGYTISIISQH